MYYQAMYAEQGGRHNLVDASSLIPAAIAIGSSVIAGAWCITQGSTIAASVSAEKKQPSVYGLGLNLIGGLVIVYGFLSAHMLMTPQLPSLMTLFSAILLLVGFILVAFITKSGGDAKSIKNALGSMGVISQVSGLVVALSFVFLLIMGGEGGEVIPETAWPLLMGAITMIGSGFAAAACIVAAVRAGSEMLIEKPELSIWSLLFVALGEGLAIYGLIVAILLIGG
jgi:V/A-type H+-transporting ATPase subunit K